MSLIWACLEQGEVIEKWLKEEPGGVYGKLSHEAGGVVVEVDFLIETDNEGERLLVLYATVEED